MTKDKIPQLYTWDGKPIEDLTREELIQALKKATDMYRELAEQHTNLMFGELLSRLRAKT